MDDAAIDALTLGEIRRIAERARVAAEDLERVRSLLGPGAAGQPPPPTAAPGPVSTNKGPVVWTPEEQAQRAGLVSPIAVDDMPPKLKKAMGG